MADLNEKQKAILEAAKKKKSSSGKTDRTVYREDWLADYAGKVGKTNVLDLIAGYIKEQDPELTKDVAGVQSKNVPGSYGKADWWGVPALRKDFQKRHKWYLDEYKKEHGVEWFPYLDQYKDKKGLLRSGAVEDFQNAFNKRAEEHGLKPYFDKSEGFDVDALWGQHTYSAPDFNELPEEPAKTPKGPVIEPSPEPYKPSTIAPNVVNTPWWLQDVINTAAAVGNRAGIKKYMPWAPPIHLRTPRPTFYDPTRELAANAEAMKIGTEGAGLFSGPQTFSSRFSRMQGEGAKNAANILANYHNKNVGVANQFEAMKTDILNKADMLNADRARKLYDQTTIANQQFDNAKRQANNEIRENYVNAITNRAMAQTLNTLYPHYQVDPMTGGFTRFDKGSRSTPTKPQSLSEQLAEVKTIAAENNMDVKDVLDYMGKGRTQDRRRDEMSEYNDPDNLSAEDQMRMEYMRQRGLVNFGPYGGYRT